MAKRYAKACVFAAGIAVSDAALLPIIMMHGIEGGERDWYDMAVWLKEMDPEVHLWNLPYYQFATSNEPMWQQLDWLKGTVDAKVKSEPDVYKDGWVFLCHSQGTLLCRGMIQTMDDHKVHTFISIAGPQQGQYGVPGQSGWNIVREQAAKLFYNEVAQGIFAAANYWKDPRSEFYPEYLKNVNFLPAMNNEPGRALQGPGKPKDDAEAKRYKANLLRLKNFVLLCGGKSDKIIIPVESQVFGFYDKDVKTIVPVENTKLWTEDWIGLKTLNDTGRLSRFVASPEENGCHTCWQQHRPLFDKYVAPHLPRKPATVVV